PRRPLRSLPPFPTRRSSDLILFENLNRQIGFRDGSPVSDRAALTRPTLDGSLEQLRLSLQRALIEQGLFAREAEAMLATWKDSRSEEHTSELQSPYDLVCRL